MRKGLVFMLCWLLLTCTGLLAQTKDTLFVVDDVTVKNIKNIKADSIFSISILKDALPPALYDRTDQVVLIIKTKQYTLKQAQSKPADSLKIVIRDAVYDGKEPFYVVDGHPSELTKVKPDSIYSMDVVKGERALAIYGSRAINGVVIITTIKYAIQLYQKKLSAFSKGYKDYFKKNNYNDERLLYFFQDGTVMQAGKLETIKKLYNLKATDIKKVDLWMHEEFSGIKMYTVNITTKN